MDASRSKKLAVIPRKVSTIPLTSGKLTGDAEMDIKAATTKLNQINKQTREIASQGGFAAFFQKGKNIRKLAEHIEMMTNVQQSTLDMIILMMNGLVITKRDYNTLMELMDELGNSSHLDKETKKFVKNARRLLDSNRVIRNSIEQLIDGHNEMLDFTKGLHNQLLESEKTSIMALKNLKKDIQSDKNCFTEFEKATSKTIGDMTTKLANTQDNLERTENSLKNHIADNTKRVNQLNNNIVSSSRSSADLINILRNDLDIKIEDIEAKLESYTFMHSDKVTEIGKHLKRSKLHVSIVAAFTGTIGLILLLTFIF